MLCCAGATMPFHWRLTLWQWAISVPLMLMLTLYHLGSHLLERHHRHLVLEVGKLAQAELRAPSGLEWVTVEWKDAAGRLHVGTAWTGKPFARHFRESRHLTRSVDIKYVDRSTETVILGEAAERDRVNDWWIKTSAGLTMVMMILLVWALLTTLWFWRVPRGN